jgi:hypothetical protein
MNSVFKLNIFHLLFRLINAAFQKVVQHSSVGKILKSFLLDPLNGSMEGTQIIQRLRNVNALKNCIPNFMPVGMS